MPFAKEHRARQASPDQFDRFRRVKPDGFPAGVETLVGFKKDGGSEVQSVVFDSLQWSASEARKWLADHDFSAGSFEEATGDREDATSIRYDALEKDGAVSRVCRRFDVMPLAKARRTKDGFVRAQGMITRSGIFSYRRADGSIVKELRAPDQVFRADSLLSFSGMPMTLDHPKENLTPKTVADHQVGTVSSPVRISNHVRADLMILREDAIAAVMNDRKNKLSCGYVATVIDQGGIFTHADGTEERFDAIQTDIIGNHVAICDNPRAGSSAQIRVDYAIADIEPETPKGDSTMEVEITINGQTYKVSKAVADQMKADGLLEAKPDPKDPPKEPEKKSDVDRAKDVAIQAISERDAARGELAAMKAKQDAKSKDDKDAKQKTDAKEATKARVELCAVASSILDKKLDELLDMDDLDIMKAVLAKEAPKMKLDDEGEAFIRGAFKTVATTKVDTAKEILKLVNGGRKTKEDGEGGDDDWATKADEARDRMVRRTQDAWKPKALRAAEKEQRESERS